MATVTPLRAEPLDVRGKTITTFIRLQIVTELDRVGPGEPITVLTDADEAIDSELKACGRATGATVELLEDGPERRYEIARVAAPTPHGKVAIVVSDPGLEQLPPPPASDSQPPSKASR